ncbi:MAG: hypothetical protein HZA91_04555 [Verrucomicrobia bacterium]|nr:hypothetical protein [Verrucomicrobiota bacterium]
MQIPVLIKRTAAVKIPAPLKLRAVRNGDRLARKPRRARSLFRRVLQALDPILPH